MISFNSFFDKIAFSQEDANKIQEALKDKIITGEDYAYYSGKNYNSHPDYPGREVITVPKGHDIKTPKGAFGLAHEAIERGYRRDADMYNKRKINLEKSLNRIVKLDPTSIKNIIVNKILRRKPKDTSRIHGYLNKKIGPSVLFRDALSGHSNSVQFSSHNSPRVLLAEHNMFTTSPKELIDKDMLELRKSKQLNLPISEAGHLEKHISNFKYGESARLSRHAIKSIMNILARKNAMFLRG